jgi:adenine-specific DNA-methyltransferase
MAGHPEGARPYYEGFGVLLYNGSAEDVLPRLADAGVGLVATDPPYFGVKADDWDNQWDTPGAFLRWSANVLGLVVATMRPNASLYWFASPQMAGRVECVIAGHLNVLNVITWAKPPHSTKAEMSDKATWRRWFQASERIVFAEFAATAAILRSTRTSYGLSTNDVGALFPSATGGPTGCVRNWELGLNTPTTEQWAAMRGLMPDLPGYEAGVRPFVAPPSNYGDVWTFPTVNTYPGKHPCEKPLALMEHIIQSSSRPLDTVLDPFAGSGTTLMAARNLGRNAIGVERDERWCEFAARRLEQGVLDLGNVA